MVNALPPSSSGFILGTEAAKDAPVGSPLATTPVAVPQVAAPVGLSQLFQAMFLNLPPEQKELAATVLEKGSPIVGGAGGAAMAAFCGACALGIAGGAMAGRDLGGLLGKAAGDAIRGPAT